MLGLPWTNPLKLTIGSDEHILDTTINRGLMMLLNNDYYLDMKETLMSQELSAVISNSNTLYDALRTHINRTEIHGGQGTTINNIYNTTVVSGGSEEISFNNQGILTQDTVVYLSITDSVVKINEKIQNIPHNLNGHNLAFIFVVPEDYNDEEVSDSSLSSAYFEYSLNVGDQCIKFTNFFNGTLFIFGDFLEQTTITSNGVTSVNFPKFTKKSKSKLEDPAKYDGIIPASYIERLYKEIDNPNSIDDIITYNSEDAKDGNKNFKRLNKIIIKGTCLNQYYSLITFSDVSAKTYVKNLKFVNTLKADKDGVIDILEQMNSNLPSKDQIMLQYPFKDDLLPIVHESFYSYVQTISNEPYFNLVSTYISSIDKAVLALSGLMLSDNVIIRDSDYVSYNVNDSVITVLNTQMNELNLLPGVSGSFFQMTLDDSGVTKLSTSILSAMEIFDLGEENIDPEVLSQDKLTECINKFKNTYDLIDSINSLKPLSEYDLYKDSSLVFEVERFSEDVKRYISIVEDFKDGLSGAFSSSAFGMFLSFRPDLYSTTDEAFDNTEGYKEFLKVYQVVAAFETINAAILGLNENVLANVISNNFDSLASDFAFKMNDGNPTFKNVKRILNTSDDYIKSNNSDGSVDSIYLYNDLAKGRSRYLVLNPENKYGKLLGKLLFERNEWPNLKQKFLGTLPDYFPMYNSKLDSTLVFWTKFNNSNDTDRTAILSFTSGTNSKFRFSIRPYSFASVSQDTINTEGDSAGNISSAELKNPIFGTDITKTKDRYSWVMWSVKFDNTSKYLYNRNRWWP